MGLRTNERLESAARFRGRFVLRISYCCFGLFLFAWSVPALAAPCSALKLVARFSDSIGPQMITGTLECMGAKVPQKNMRLFRFPDFLADEDGQGLDDVNRHWLYPEGFEPGGMQVQRQGLAWTFRTQVPSRAGVFGVRRGVVYALAGWHPLPVGSRRLNKTNIEYNIFWPAHRVGFVGNKAVGRAPMPRWIRGQFFGFFLPVLVADTIDVRKSQSGRTWLLNPRTDMGMGLREFNTHLQHQAQANIMKSLEIVEQSIPWAKEPLPNNTQRRPMILVQAPLLHRFSLPFEGGVLLTERAFQLLPVQAMQRFHAQALWRAYLGAYWQQRLPVCDSELSAEQAAAVIAVAETRTLASHAFSDHRSAEDILKPFALTPEIDSMAFAPQMPFVDAYFTAIDDTPQVLLDVYDRLWYGELQEGSGSTIFAKLVDRFGYARVQNFLHTNPTHLCVDAEWAKGLGEDPQRVRAMLNPWLGVYPKLDYQLQSIEALGAGKTQVQIISVTEDGMRPPEEPLSVDVELRSAYENASVVKVAASDGASAHTASRFLNSGAVHENCSPSSRPPCIEVRGPRLLRLTRLGAGRTTVPVSVDNISQVRLDPERRLVEYLHPHGQVALYNNSQNPRWRLLLNNIAGIFALTNGEFAGSADFTLKRDYDLRWRFGGSAFYSPDSVGGALSLARNMGERLTPLRLASRVGLVFAAERLLRQRSGALEASQLSTTVFFNHDTRVSARRGMRGRGLNVRGVFAAGKDDGGKKFTLAQLGVGAFAIVPTGAFGGILGRLRADVQVGSRREQNLFSVGGRYRGGRGYERDEARGTVRLLGSVEHRHVLEADAHTNFWGLLTFTGMEGALFADAIWLNASKTRSDCPSDFFFDVGYGLRFFGDVLNVQPGTVQLDFGLPLGRCKNERSRLPLSIYLAFMQSFAAF